MPTGLAGSFIALHYTVYFRDSPRARAAAVEATEKAAKAQGGMAPRAVVWGITRRPPAASPGAAEAVAGVEGTSMYPYSTARRCEPHVVCLWIPHLSSRLLLPPGAVHRPVDVLRTH